MERKSNKVTAQQRTIHLLEYLRKDTDENHRVKSGDIQKAFEKMGVEEHLGAKNTRHDLIVNLARACNEESNGILKSEYDWLLIYDDFMNKYGSKYCEEDEYEDEDIKQESIRIENLYYNHIFSYDEINALIEGIRFSRTILSDDAESIISRIKGKLISKYYKESAKNICMVREAIGYDKEVLRQNLLTIQTAITDGVQIEFQFNAYNEKKKLEAISSYKTRVSPYYIVANSGKYYLLAANKTYNNTAIWRIDLMTDVQIPEKDDAKNRKGTKSLKKDSIIGMPQQWDENFPYEHINMSFDSPETITLRIKKPKDTFDPLKQIQQNYTFLYDSFGDTFRHVQTEKEAPYGDIIEVRCSPYGMVNWALQFSNRVEVLKPEKVRDAIVEKIKVLSEKYSE